MYIFENPILESFSVDYFVKYVSDIFITNWIENKINTRVKKNEPIAFYKFKNDESEPEHPIKFDFTVKIK